MSASASRKVWLPRPCLDQELEGFAALIRGFVPEVRDASHRQRCSPDYYRWKFLSDPYGPSSPMVVDDGGRIIGTNGSFAKPLWFRGQSLAGAELSDLFVDPGYQGQGISSRLLRSVTQSTIDKGLPVVYGCPNDAALPIEKKIGYLVAEEAGVVALARPLDFGAAVEHRLPLPPALERARPWLGRVAGPLARAGYGLLHPLRRDARVRQRSGIPEAALAHWPTLRRRYHFAVDRSPGYWQWRYLDHPDAARHRTFQLESGGRAGCLVAKLQQGARFNVAYLMDWVVTDDDPGLLAAVASETLRSLAAEGAQVSIAWAPRASIHHAVLLHLGFRVFEEIPVIVFGTELGKTVVEQARRWYFTIGDSDAL